MFELISEIEYEEENESAQRVFDYKMQCLFAELNKTITKPYRKWKMTPPD